MLRSTLGAEANVSSFLSVGGWGAGSCDRSLTNQRWWKLPSSLFLAVQTQTRTSFQTGTEPAAFPNFSISAALRLQWCGRVDVCGSSLRPAPVRSAHSWSRSKSTLMYAEWRVCTSLIFYIFHNGKPLRKGSHSSKSQADLTQSG